MKPDDEIERNSIVLRPGEKQRRKVRRDRRHHAERTAVNETCEVRTSGSVRLQHGSTGQHGYRREADEPHFVRRETPLCGALPHDLDGLNAIGNAVPAATSW